MFLAVDEGDMELPSPDALFRDRRDDPGLQPGWGRWFRGYGWVKLREERGAYTFSDCGSVAIAGI